MEISSVVKVESKIKKLLAIVRSTFDEINEIKKRHSDSEYSLSDCLMSALAIFTFKMPSLLSFEKCKETEIIKHNLGTLFGVKKTPSDTYLREKLDDVDLKNLRKAFKEVFATLQRDKQLESFVFLDGYYLVGSDGTGFFSSPEIHCENCCVKQHHDGTKTYYHQMLGAVLLHPDKKEVIPLCPEPILKSDGSKKNDCERNASKRLLSDFRREHPHLKTIIVEDALASNGPHIQELKKFDIRFILGVKPDGNKALFEWLKGISLSEHVKQEEDRTYHLRFINDVPLNDVNKNLMVNFLEVIEIGPDGTQKHFTWITDIFITRENVFTLMRGGRARWHIENETFNTLKNQGYHFEHNFGHGYKNLSSVFGMLMFLAFLIDQAQQLCCPLFRAALEKEGGKSYLWDKLRGLISFFLIRSWDEIFHSIARACFGGYLVPDTS